MIGWCIHNLMALLGSEGNFGGRARLKSMDHECVPLRTLYCPQCILLWVFCSHVLSLLPVHHEANVFGWVFLSHTLPWCSVSPQTQSDGARWPKIEPSETLRQNKFASFKLTLPGILSQQKKKKKKVTKHKRLTYACWSSLQHLAIYP